MKRIVAFLLTLLLLLGSTALAEETIDLTKMTPAELEALIAAAQHELTMQEDRLIERSIEMLKDFFRSAYEHYGRSEEGYLEIVHTQVVYIKDEIIIDERLSKSAALFDDVDAIVEFIVLDDYFGAAPYYMLSNGVMSVLQHRDGSLEVTTLSLFNRYRSATYTNDFTPIIESISDRNAEFNGAWYLLK